MTAEINVFSVTWTAWQQWPPAWT